MNLSNVVTRIKLKLGLINIVTPIENINSFITDIIKEITVPVFSIYCPYRKSMPFNSHDFELLEKVPEYEKFLLPEIGGAKIIDIEGVSYDASVVSDPSFYIGGYPTYAMGNLFNESMLSNAGKQAANLIIPAITFEFQPPRVLIVYNMYYSSRIIIEFALEHDKSLATIPETARESFIDLALLDVKENLYPTLKNYTELNTAIGTINLKLDDWQNAEEQRKELLDKWQDTYHLDRKTIYYI